MFFGLKNEVSPRDIWSLATDNCLTNHFQLIRTQYPENCVLQKSVLIRNKSTHAWKPD